MLINQMFTRSIFLIMLGFFSFNVHSQILSKQHERLIQPHVISAFSFDFEKSLAENSADLYAQKIEPSSQNSDHSIAFNFYDYQLNILSVTSMVQFQDSNNPHSLRNVISVDYLGEEKIQVIYHNDLSKNYVFNLFELEVTMLETLKTVYNEQLTNQVVFFINWDSFETADLKKEVFERSLKSYINFMELVSKSTYDQCIRNLSPKQVSLLKSNFELVFLLDEWKLENSAAMESLSISEDDFFDYNKTELYEYDELTNKSKY